MESARGDRGRGSVEKKGEGGALRPRRARLGTSERGLFNKHVFVRFT